MDAAVKAVAAQHCADCRAARPRYASVTLGVWLCNRCYGIHRSVGAHITRTKCVGLDLWSTQDLHRMKCIGNERAASYWEGLVPIDHPRPGPNSSDGEVEKWIRDKYEKKMFCPRHMMPPLVPQFQEKPSSSASTSGARSQGPSLVIPPPPPPRMDTSNVQDDEDEFGSFVQAS